MSQKSNLFYNFISNKYIYIFLQKLMSATSVRKNFVKVHIKKEDDEKESESEQEIAPEPQKKVPKKKKPQNEPEIIIKKHIIFLNITI